MPVKRLEWSSSSGTGQVWMHFFRWLVPAKKSMKQKSWHPRPWSPNTVPSRCSKSRKWFQQNSKVVSTKIKKRTTYRDGNRCRRPPPSSPLKQIPALVEANPHAGSSIASHRSNVLPRTSSPLSGRNRLRRRTAAPRPRIHGPGSPWPWAQIAAAVFGEAAMEEI